MAEFLIGLLLKVLDRVSDRVLDAVFNWLPGSHRKSKQEIRLYPTTCGDRGIDLSDQRLFVSTVFGSYFSGLLEADSTYCLIDGQIECPSHPEAGTLTPLERIFWSLRAPRGPQLFMIAADGGMGKTTLATKVIRCLWEQGDIDTIIGDSAKAQAMDIASGEIKGLRPSFEDPWTFYGKLSDQLGLPRPDRQRGLGKAAEAIRDRLAGRRSSIVVDNLETVKKGDTLVQSLLEILSRDIRAIITSRKIIGFEGISGRVLSVRLRPLDDIMMASQFLRWHIATYQAHQPQLAALAQGLQDPKLVRRLIEKTGGVPLLMQLLASDIALRSWSYLDYLPENRFGVQLLDFLYRERWDELGRSGDAGLFAQVILARVAEQQYQGKRITMSDLQEWAQTSGGSFLLDTALQLLEERFLLINRDPSKGNFSVFPSLADFAKAHAVHNISR